MHPLEKIVLLLTDNKEYTLESMQEINEKILYLVNKYKIKISKDKHDNWNNIIKYAIKDVY